MSSRNQNTIAQPVSLTGFGYWSGADVTMTFKPAPENSGITFVRYDLPEFARLPAVISNQTQSARRTNLAHGEISVEMIEHVMAALAGLQIDNCEVWVDSPEMPGFDGSAQLMVEALDEAGVFPQIATRGRRVVMDSMRIGDAECGWIQIEPAESFRLTYHLKYSDFAAIGEQSIDLEISPRSFREELASARTFVTKSEADWFLSQGLGQRVRFDQLLVFGDNGPIDNTLRYENECVRHKALDVIGDIALCGHDLVGHITAFRSGHQLNRELVRHLPEISQIDPPQVFQAFPKHTAKLRLSA